MTVYGILMILLRARLRGTGLTEAEKEAVAGVDRKELYLLADRHDLAHAVGDVLAEEGLLSGAAATAFGRKQYLAAFRYERIVYELSRLRALLEEESVDFIPLKGSVLRDCYPDPVIRTSCDIDVLIRVEEIPRVSALVKEKLGYREDNNAEGKTEDQHDVTFFTESELHVELHFTLEEEGVQGSGLLKQPWENAVLREGTAHEYLLSPAFFWLYHITHAAKHFKAGGCGVRPFMDIWVMKQAVPPEEKNVEALWEKEGVAPFGRAAVALAELWFGTGERTPLLSAMEEYIFTGGTYGTFQNKMAARQRKESRGAYLCKRIFPSYKTMVKGYPSLKKLPFLLPFYWIARWFGILFRGRGRKAWREIQDTRVDTTRRETTAALFDALSL